MIAGKSKCKWSPGLAGLLGLLASMVLLLSGCGGGYDDPTVQRLTRTETPLITAATLKEWIDRGLVNSNEGENVVILEVGTTASYSGAHIPGAHLWSQPELVMTRLEGLAAAGNSVVTGAVMDQVLQPSGVNRYSTIVLTYPGTGLNNPARAYFTLRYWGFPKERIKVLNGGNSAWDTAVLDNGWPAGTYGLTAEIPLPDNSNTFSVSENKSLRSDLRYSLGEMIQAVDANIASGATGPAVNIINQSSVIPAGQPPTVATAIARPASAFSAAGSFRSAAEIEEILFEGKLDGVPVQQSVGEFKQGLPSIVHCASGMSAAPIFFALDAILGLDVALYDGSTNQWNAYKAKAEGITGTVPNNAWRTDLFGRTPEGVPTTTNTNIIETSLNLYYTSTADQRANQVETEDAEYMAASGSSGTGPATPGYGG
jgi:3-mercaptopyruvate sulfurtransferase SseA